MASMVASTGALALVGCMALLVSTRPAAAEMSFDLPAQPLKQALAQYDAQTSVSVFFPSELADGRTSTEVRGRFEPEQALRRLLEGTGVGMRAVAGDAFVLVPEALAGDAPAAAAQVAPTVFPRVYEGRVQSRIWQALCAREGVALGGYRLALSIRIDAAGRVHDARLLDTTGDRARDALILDTVRRVDVGQGPGDSSRPFVLLSRPRAEGAPPACLVLH
jgi:hypothetical protein